MSTLYIFADEAGTMPKKDSDGIFVTSAIAFFDEPPSIPPSPKARNRSHLAEVLAEQNGHPSVTLLVPYDGYERDITDKFDQWEVMGQVTYETTGANQHYLRDPNSGKPPLSRPNMIWGMYMQDVILNVLCKAFLRGRREVSEIRIVLDQKSLSEKTKALFCDQLLGTGERLRGTLQGLPLDPGLIHQVLERVQFDQHSLHVQWEGDQGMEWAADGLALADTLASAVLTDLKGNSDKPMIELLEQNWFSDVIVNRTEWVTAPVNTANRKTWEESTGAKIQDVRDLFKAANGLDLKPEYRQVRFRCDEEELPEMFQIVTAHNPDGETVDQESNEQADALLKARLEEAGWRHFRVTGGSPDFSHSEPGYGIECSREEALALAREFRQDAIFEVSGGAVFLISAKGLAASSEEIGLWSALSE